MGKRQDTGGSTDPFPEEMAGQTKGQETDGGKGGIFREQYHQSRPCMKTSRRMTRKYRRGLIKVRSCMKTGMLAMGVANPERMIDGTRKRKAPSNPCCWVETREEIIRPTPRPERVKRKIPR